ncbi:MAG TPA: molybdenum cofactor guanylyltransferase [Pirellulales bacterium]
MDKSDFTDVSLAMIAGGMGRRMGIPKAWLQINGQSILAWFHARLQWQGPTMLVSAPSSRNPPDAHLFDQAIVDPVDDLGPLGGILTALEHLTTPTVVIVAVDMPNIDSKKLHWLASELTLRPQCQGVMCRIDGNSTGRIEPFPSAFRRAAAESIRQRLHAQRRSIQELCEEPNFCAVKAPHDWPKDTWANLNDPHQFAKFLAALTNQPTENSR